MVFSGRFKKARGTNSAEPNNKNALKKEHDKPSSRLSAKKKTEKTTSRQSMEINKHQKKQENNVFAGYFEKTASGTKKEQPTQTGKGAMKSEPNRHKNSANSHSSRKRKQQHSKGEVEPKTSQQQKRTRHAPSEEALKLSDALKERSRLKDLDGALQLYNDPSNDSIRDNHHLCIVIDCCARCGRIQQGEELLQSLANSGTAITVETQTALLKGYAHAGKMQKADALFQSMVKSQRKVDRPNTRTLNTLLRGCLWSASHADENGVLTGGVVTIEKAWRLCAKSNDSGLEESMTDTLAVEYPSGSIMDVSSFEYSVATLCQALRIPAAKLRIQEFESMFHAKSSEEAPSQSVTESLALSYLALARACATLGQKNDAKKAATESLTYAEISKKALRESDKPSSSTQRRKAVKQGKESKEGRREESNTLYRGHRLKEVETDARLILDLCKNEGIVSNPRSLARRLVTRLIVVGGGGTTEADSSLKQKEAASSRAIQTQLMNTLFFSYGLQQVLQQLNIPWDDRAGFVRRKDCYRFLGAIGLQGGVVQDDGKLDLKRIYGAGLGEKGGKKGKGAFEIELGSGYGDWIVRKAQQNPNTNYMSIELRADRVGQTFARTALLAATNPVDNLCIVGAESNSFLVDYIPTGSVDAIYINHPEPPTQTFGADESELDAIMKGGPEPAHMISSSLVRTVGGCLSTKRPGKLVIVTDNKWYGRLICATIVKVMQQEDAMFREVYLDDPWKTVETFEGSESGSTVTLYQGQPDESVGHFSPNSIGSGSTYFDRLWRSGAGTHAERTSRFAIVVERVPAPATKSTKS
eukprot:Nitzschia sp. Nitz4//scaffold131_size63436//2315//4753//NITZ4_006259-RA/size63436-processed-gene-0.92-mRNA-1//1//CDS//3329535220//2359//frame0